MKRLFLSVLLLPLLMAASFDYTPTSILSSWSLYKGAGTGTVLIKDLSSKEECQDKAVAYDKVLGDAKPKAKLPVSTKYTCRQDFTITVVKITHIDPPPITNPDPIPPVITPPAGPAPMPAMHTGISVNATAIPASAAGYSTDRVMISPPGQQAYVPTPTDIGAFRDSCAYSHMLFDDPIVYPGQPGESHLHTFVGNTGANAFSTTESVSNTGNSTCGGGTLNRTAYWFPSLIDTIDGTPIAPLSVNVYYKTGYDGVRNQDIQPFPDGLKFISGDPMNAIASGNAGRWSCDTPTGNTGWRTEIPNDCKPGSGLLMVIGFPQCWDGKNLDSLNHKDHMAFANWQNYVTAEQLAGQPLQWYQTLTPTQGCPPTHPVALPQISYNVWYQIPQENPSRIQTDWRLSCDVYDKSLPGGYCIHGDYLLGWKREIMQTWVKNCDAASFDCHDFVLGDGRTLY